MALEASTEVLRYASASVSRLLVKYVLIDVTILFPEDIHGTGTRWSNNERYDCFTVFIMVVVIIVVGW